MDDPCGAQDWPAGAVRLEGAGVAHCLTYVAADERIIDCSLRSHLI